MSALLVGMTEGFAVLVWDALYVVSGASATLLGEISTNIGSPSGYIVDRKGFTPCAEAVGLLGSMRSFNSTYEKIRVK